jgi:hydroxysqualene dehydroxylase
MVKQVAVIGGGLAGLAAATELASRGIQVSVFETNHQLGGRARSVLYQNVTLDNGQHIMLGAYHETLRLLRLAGADTELSFMRFPLALSVKDLLTDNAFELNVPAYLPAPLHLLVGLLGAKGISLKAKWHAVRLMHWMRCAHFHLKHDEPLGEFLSRKQQSPTLIQYLWEPLCLAALNTPIQTASAQIFLNVLKDSFNQQKQDADLLLPKQDLTQLLSEPLAQYIMGHQGKLMTGTTIKSLTYADGQYLLSNGVEKWSFSHAIIACGPHQLANLTANLPQFSARIAHFNYEPITTVYLQYPSHTRLPSAMLGSVNSLSQWIFDRGQLTQQAGLIAVVISAHSAFKQTQSELAMTIATELLGHFPNIGRPLWHKVITEKRATFRCVAGLARPSNQTNYPNLLLAGDYTAGDYPATIESAVRSGIAAANLC